MICLADLVLENAAEFNNLLNWIYFKQWMVINQKLHSACFGVGSRSPLKQPLGLKLFLTS